MNVKVEEDVELVRNCHEPSMGRPLLALKRSCDICGGDFHAVISKPWLLEAIKVCGCGSGAVIYKPRIKAKILPGYPRVPTR